MPTKVVLGLQWGDEGKGKVVDNLVHNWANVCVRYQGGPNAGHTIYNDLGKKFVTHALPSGVLKNDCLNVIAKGCVVNPISLKEEIDNLNIDINNLKISDQCPLILPHHIINDKLKYYEKIGTTSKGIGPAYSEYIARNNKTIFDLCYNFNDLKSYIFSKFVEQRFENNYTSETLNNVLRAFIAENNYQTLFVDLSYDAYTFKFFNEEYFPKLEKLSLFYKNMICNTDDLLQKLYKENKNIILEGAQGWGLDIWGRSYPNVTSSCTNIGGVLTYTGLNHKQINEVIGVVKSYKSVVGTGIFNTELNIKKSDEDTLRENLNEFGSTTGRPRRLGWLDLDEVKNACLQNGVDKIVITRIDSLKYFNYIEDPYLYKNNNFDFKYESVKHEFLNGFYVKKNENLNLYKQFSYNESNEDILNDLLNDKNLNFFLNDIKDFLNVDVAFSYGQKRNQLKW